MITIDYLRSSNMVRWNMAGMFPPFWSVGISQPWFPGGWTCISGVARGTGGVVLGWLGGYLFGLL